MANNLSPVKRATTFSCGCSTPYNCKITWKAGDSQGCNYKWTTVSFSTKKPVFKYTKQNCTKNVIGKPTIISGPLTSPDPASWGPTYSVGKPYVKPGTPSLPSPPGWNPPLSKDLPITDAPHISCDCLEPEKVDPVYATAFLFYGIGVGLNRSHTIICNTDNMNVSGNFDPCPPRAISYHMHVNRLTERYKTSRSTK